MLLLRSDQLTRQHVDQLKILKKPKGNPGGRKKKIRYRDAVCAFDIETTTCTPQGHDEPVNWMYIWQFQLGQIATFYGRTWQEFREFISALKAYLKGDLLVTYDHNLSYEWQYLKGLYFFDSSDVFATDQRKVLKCILDGTLELRDSLALSNMSLAAFCKKYDVEHQKLSGIEYDYHKIRYPWTELSDRELLYCVNDVRGLVEAVQAQMDRDGDTLYTIPMTATGYPRRETKTAMRGYSRQRLLMIQPDYFVYTLLREGFRGGNTHTNRYFAGSIVDRETAGGDIMSWDRISSYPDTLMNDPYPMGRWIKAECTKENLRNIMRQKKAVIFRCRFSALRLRNPRWPVPYLTTDKGRADAPTIDNGRVMTAVSYETVLTDIDFRIVLSEYCFEDVEILEMYFTEYGMLPRPFREVIRHYYEQKTKLKGLKDPFSKMQYDKAKALLNGLYGMLAQDPCKPELIWNGLTFETAEEDPAQTLAKATRKAFTSYAWGVWCTAWARYRLEEGIMIAGPDDFIYCDTDSVKYIDRGQDWTAYNEKRIADSIRNHAYAEDRNMHTYYMGVYEKDAEYLRFSSLGSKRYAYEDERGELHITISGVSKNAAPEMGTLENFREGFTFEHPGKTEADYVDDPPKEIIIDGHSIEMTSYVIISETTYTLSLSDNYRNLLRLIAKE